MDRDPVEVIEKDGWKAGVYFDDDAQSPKEWDNVGTLATWHRRYCFDEDGRERFGSADDFMEWAKETGAMYILVGMYDHSGISLYSGGGPHAFDQQGWDSGTVGVMYTTPERWKELMGDTPYEFPKVEEVLEQDLYVWDQFVTGDVYGVVVEGPKGEDGDGVWGFYGFDYAKLEALTMLTTAIEHEKQEAAKIQRVMAL